MGQTGTFSIGIKNKSNKDIGSAEVFKQSINIKGNKYSISGASNLLNIYLGKSIEISACCVGLALDYLHCKNLLAQ